MGDGTIPTAATVAVVVEDNGQFLLVEEERNGIDRPVWYFPAGALEPGETLAEAAAREVREETGYEIEPSGIVAINHGHFSTFVDLPWWRFVISARLASKDQYSVDEASIISVGWWAVDDIPNLKLRNPDVQQLCALLHSGSKLIFDQCFHSEDGILTGFFA